MKKIIACSILILTTHQLAEAKTKKHGPETYASVFEGAYIVSKTCPGMKMNNQFFIDWEKRENFSSEDKIKFHNLIANTEQDIQLAISKIGPRQLCNDLIAAFTKYFPGPVKPIIWE